MLFYFQNIVNERSSSPKECKFETLLCLLVDHSSEFFASLRCETKIYPPSYKESRKELIITYWLLLWLGKGAKV
jgi:hypothetical protein